MEVRMKVRSLFCFLMVLALAGFFSSAVHADGIIVPQPPICRDWECPPLPQPIPLDDLVVKYHHVTVKIENQVAVTHVDQVFLNPNDTQIEGDYFFPIPSEAAVSGFTLWVDGKPVHGKVLSADQARQLYQQIVSSLRDPALLEYADRGAVQAHIFPIPAGGERRIELEYSQALTAENGLVRYVYPLNTEKFSAKPLEDVSISVQIAASQPIRAVYSPTHTVSVGKPDERHATAGYEAKDVKPDTDFALYYSIGESEAFHLLTYRNPTDPADPDGFFMLLLAPKADVSTAPIPKDVLLVLDHSGSMEGEKFRQVQAASQYVLSHLNKEDRFDVIAFSTSVESYAPSLRPAGDAPAASAWLDGLSAQGSTDINRALLEAASLADKERATYLIFLTDGLPTEGEQDVQKIISNFSTVSRPNLRLFPFGVGYDVDTTLLDTLAGQNHGATTYVQPNEALDEALSSFYARISTPVLTDLKLMINGVSTYDLYPSPLPDLFLGSQIVLVGRYKDGGSASATLTGSVRGQTQTFDYPELAFDTQTGDPSASLTALPRLWATRKIGALLSKIRLDGPDQETIDQIVAISIRYGIVTPYTSYLVTEPSPLGADARSQIAHDQYESLSAAPAAPSSGQGAVNKAADEGRMAGASAASEIPAESQGQIRTAGSHTFTLADGVWTDTAYDPKKMKTTQVSFLSPDYFKLSAATPDLAAALALGERVIVVAGDKVYEVVSAGQKISSLALPTQSASQTAVAPSNLLTQAPIVARSTAKPPAPTSVPEPSSPAAQSPSLLWLAILIPVGAVVYLIRRLK
jgi:Ca-activated chloride channel homolog